MEAVERGATIVGNAIGVGAVSGGAVVRVGVGAGTTEVVAITTLPGFSVVRGTFVLAGVEEALLVLLLLAEEESSRFLFRIEAASAGACGLHHRALVSPLRT